MMVMTMVLRRKTYDVKERDLIISPKNCSHWLKLSDNSLCSRFYKTILLCWFVYRDKFNDLDNRVNA